MSAVFGSDLGWNIDKKKQFAPRIGVTYQLDEKTVIRAGYGRSFDTGVFGSIFGHTVTQNMPVLANQQINNQTANGEAFNLAAGPTPYTADSGSFERIVAQSGVCGQFKCPQ